MSPNNFGRTIIKLFRVLATEWVETFKTNFERFSPEPRTQNNYKTIHRNYRGSKTFQMKYHTAHLLYLRFPTNYHYPPTKNTLIKPFWGFERIIVGLVLHINGNTFTMVVRLKWPPCLWFLCYSVIISYEYTNLVDMNNYKVKNNNKQVIVDSAKIQLIPEKVWIMFCTL